MTSTTQHQVRDPTSGQPGRRGGMDGFSSELSRRRSFPPWSVATGMWRNFASEGEGGGGVGWREEREMEGRRGRGGRGGREDAGWRWRERFGKRLSDRGISTASDSRIGRLPPPWWREGTRAKLGGVKFLPRVCLGLLVQCSRADLLPSVHAVGGAQAQGEADGERHRRETHPIQQGVSGEASYLLPSTVQIKDQC